MRTPHRMILRYRAHINVAALALMALGFTTAFDARLQSLGAATILGTFLAWLWLRNRIRPTVPDYLEHLRVSAEKERLGEWLDRVNGEFMGLWEIKRLEEVAEP